MSPRSSPDPLTSRFYSLRISSLLINGILWKLRDLIKMLKCLKWFFSQMFIDNCKSCNRRKRRKWTLGYSAKVISYLLIKIRIACPLLCWLLFNSYPWPESQQNFFCWEKIFFIVFRRKFLLDASEKKALWVHLRKISFLF